MVANKSVKLTAKLNKSVVAMAIIVAMLAVCILFIACPTVPLAKAEAAAVDGGSGNVDATVDTFAATVDTGASVTVNASDDVTHTAAGVDAAAEVDVTVTATVTFGQNISAAFGHGKLNAKLYVNGSNDFTTGAGTSVIKSADYTVGGALVGNGSLAEETDFANLEIPTTKGTDFQKLTFTYRVHLKSEHRSAGMAETHAAVSAQSTVSLTIAFEFEKDSIVVEVQNGGSLLKGGTEVVAADAQTRTVTYPIDFAEALDFSIEPADGYYFVGWKFSAQDVRSGKKATFGTTQNPIVYGHDMSGDIEVTAVFQPITLSNASTSYTYDAIDTGNGPSIATSLKASYDVKETYSGTSNSGAVLTDSETKPINAGDYVYTGYMYYKGDEQIAANVVGKVVRSYSITRNAPALDREDGNLTEQTILYGGTLEEVNLKLTARNSANITASVSGTVAILLDGEPVDTTKLLPADPDGTDYTIRFTPGSSYSANYTYSEQTIRIFVTDSIVVRAYNANGTTRKYSLAKSEVTSVDADVPNNMGGKTLSGETIKISLRAEMTDDSGQYFFIGWRMGLASTGYSYLTAGATDGLNYDFYLPRVGDVKSVIDEKTVKYTKEDVAEYISAEFVAMFVLDTTTALGSNSLSVTYTGGSRSQMPTFSPENAGHGFGSTDVEYYDDADTRLTGAPSKIGNYTIKYTIRNTELNADVGVREISYTITAGTIQAELNESKSVGEGNYNASTGWAKKKYYTLSVKGLLAGAVDKYYYKSGDSDWAEVEGSITGSGCRITFATPDATNVSVVSVYTFMAKDADGNIVAETSGEGVECKIDGTSPRIDSLTTTYAGGWVKDDVAYSANVSYGGSGAVIDVYYVGRSSGWVRLDSDIDFLDGDSTQYVTNTAITFTIREEYSGDIRFRIRNGVGVTAEYGSSLPINIDKTLPALGDGERDNNLNANGWINSATEISFTVTDAGGSAISEVGCDTTTVTSKGNGVYSITVTDSARYVVYVRDNAGNYSEHTYFAPVDTDDLTYALADDSFVAGNWTNSIATVAFDVNVGASGARLYYSTDGVTYSLCVADGSFVTGDTLGVEPRDVRLEYVADVADGEYTYWFRIENGAGIRKEYKFGVLGLDRSKPVFTDITDISAYQGVAWTSNVIYVEFRVSDTADVQSGIASVVSDNGGNVTYDATSGKYSLAIDKCTPFTVSATDNAGNKEEHVFKANVDTVEPVLDIRAYVGGGNVNDVTEEPTGTYAEYDFKSWITASEPEPWIRLEFTINLTASGSALEISDDGGTTWKAITGTYRPEGSAVSGTVSTRAYITQEQNKSYKFRLATGSGRKVTFDPVSDGDAYVRIDFTAPILRTSSYVVGYDTNFPAETKWTSQAATWRILPGDTAGGSGVNRDSIALYEFEISVPDADVNVSNIGTATKREMSLSGSYFTCEFTEYKKYLLVFEDNAGNAYAGTPFSPKVDMTTGFTLTLDAAVRAEGASGSYDFTSGEWLQNDRYAEFIGTPAFAEEGKSFGPSGVKMQFSVDGGTNWAEQITVGTNVSTVVYDEDNGRFVFSVSGDQVMTYKFRLVTGAGAAYVAEGEYTVKRDGVTPSLGAVATVTTDGTASAYNGEWTNKTVDITVTSEHGVSGGTLQYKLGENGEWQTLATVGKNIVSTGSSKRTDVLKVEDSFEGKVYFRYVSGKAADGKADIAEVAGGVTVKTDKTPVVVSVTASGANGVSVQNGGWTYGTMTLTAGVTVGNSGIDKVYMAYSTDGENFTDYQAISVAAGVYAVSFEAVDGEGAPITSVFRTYKFKVTSLSGMEAESVSYGVGVDNADVSLAPTYSGSKVESASGVFADWYLTTVSVSLNPGQDNASGYKMYYKYEESDGNGGWSGDDVWTEVNATFALGYKEDGTPDDRAGGLDRRYYFKTVTGAGKENVYSSAGKEWVYLPIDLHAYYVRFHNKVGDILLTDLVDCAQIRGAGESYRRGDSVGLGYTPQEGFRFKSMTITGLTVPQDASFNNISIGEQTVADNNYAITNVTIYIGGGDVDCNVRLYKEITPVYYNNKQYLQSGALSHIGVRVTEDAFAEIYGTPGIGDGYSPELTAEYALNGVSTSTVPTEIGVYEVTVSVAADYADDYFVSAANGKTTFTVVYFTGNGTSVDPHLVKSAADFAYIDTYMSDDDYDFLGTSRKTAYFKQTADIAVGADFTPMGSTGDGFTGIYDGNGYKVYSTRTLTAGNANFGLFANVTGASIINLGVEFDITGTSVGTIGSIAANAVSSGIRECYAIGDITVSGDDICVGGIVGKAESTLVFVSYADVHISVDKSSGYVGGVVGRAIKCFTAGVFTVSAISVTDSHKYDSVAEAGIEFLYAGAVIGSVEALGGAGSLPQSDSLYLDKNVAYDGGIETGVSIGNAHSVSNYNALRHVACGIDAFAADSTAYTLIHNIIDRSYTLSVKELTYRRIEAEKEGKDVEGNGTSEDPFIIDGVSKLALIEIFPWACFKQTCDITVGETQGYAYASPFVGIYDGDGYALRGIKMLRRDTTAEGTYGGLLGVLGGTIKNLKIVDAEYEYYAKGTVYAGGLVGYAGEGAVIDNVVISGSLHIGNAESGATAFVGGITGAADGANITASVTLISVTVATDYSVVGGIAGLVKGESVIDDVMTMSTVNVDYTRRGDTGAVIGAVGGTVAEVKNIGYLASSCYACGNTTAAIVGSGNLTVNASAYAYKDVADASANITVNGRLVSEIIDGLYPFSGKGTEADPFKVSSYRELLLIGDYMYASFMLIDDIYIGDFDGDGLADEDYGYDYSPIGGDAAFTGSFNGQGHTIFGLTDSLFTVNAGSISWVTLNVSYKVYAKESDIPDSDKFTDGETVVYKAKVAERGEDILFGAAAKVNRAEGTVTRVYVTGEVYVKVAGNAHAIVGGLVGVDLGGNIVGSNVSASITVRSSYAEVGGVVGVISDSAEALAMIDTNGVTSDKIDVGGGTVHAGTYVGAVRAEHSYEPEYSASVSVVVNGTEAASVYVGYEK